MKTTGNLGLKKPEGTDLVDIADLNGNMDILDNAVTGKVDKVTGKQLSTNDYTAAEKTKLAGIATGANNYTHPNHTGDVTSTGDGVTAIAAGVIVDTDVNANAGIKFSKINAAGSIMDSDINDEAYINMLKIGTGKINNATLDQLYGVTAPIQGQLNERVKQTTASITYYVRSDGNDNNTGLSNTAGAAFKTIAKAVSMLPKIGEHSRSIKIAAGTYAEAIDLKGFGGSGPIEIASLGTLASGVTNVQRVNVVGCSSQITLIGITSTATTDNAFDVIACTWVWLSNCYALSGGGGTTYGVCAYGSNVIVSNGIYSNKGGAIWSRNSSNVFATNIQGANNSIGYLATEGSKIGLSANTLTAVLLSDAKQGGLILGDPRESSIPLQTTADITYYVRTDGNDSNTGLANTAAGAFKTINKAISMIPQILNHVVTINVASGSYSESVKISGKEGSAHVEFLGTSATIIGFTAERCKRIVVNGFTATSTIGAAFNVYDGGMIDIRNCIVIASAASQPGITISAQKADIRNCTISNRNMGIFTENGEVTSITNTGTGNVIGIYSSHSGSINKYGTQPNGTTPEAVLNGTITSGVLNPWGDNTTGMRTGVATGGGGSLQSIPANVFTKVNYSNEYFDYLDEWSNSKFTAKKNGLYAINTLLTFIGAADGTIAEVIVYKNGSKDQCIGRGGAVKFQDLSISGFTITDLNAGDTIELYVQQFGSAALNLTNDGSYTNLRITRVS
ncbi:hypothetical protein [Paenibacillus sp. NPDC101420]|uniref:hypothetical protein n=1 Tax=Paenibacillus sp. NPDC101420 TaxID=3390602 RepID=UPI003D01EC39